MNAPRSAVLTRQPSTPTGTPGWLTTDTGKKYATIERQWLDDKPDVSSIPLGRYLCKFQWSEKHGKALYHVLGVPGRTVIEIHAANVYEQLLGCVAVGLDHATFAAGSIHPGVPSVDMVGVTHSGPILDQFHHDMKDQIGNQQDFWLEIKEA